MRPSFSRSFVALCALATAWTPGRAVRSRSASAGARPAHAGIPSTGRANPLAAITVFARRMDRSMNALLRGVAPRQAFAPVLVSPEGLETLRTRLRRAGVRRARLILLELEITFHRPPARVEAGVTPVMMFKVGVAPWPTPALAQVKLVRLAFSPRFRPEQALARFTGAAAPLERVARALLDAASAGRCGTVPLVIPAAWRGLFPGRRDRVDLTRDTASARRALVPACRQVRSLARRRVNLMPDDMVFAALDRSGRLRGLIRCDPGWQGGPPRLRLRSCIYLPRQPVRSEGVKR